MENASPLIKKYDKIISKHPGKWVAISNDKIIATSQNIEELTKKIQHKNDILVAYSPTPSEKKVGYLLQTVTTLSTQRPAHSPMNQTTPLVQKQNKSL